MKCVCSRPVYSTVPRVWPGRRCQQPAPSCLSPFGRSIESGPEGGNGPSGTPPCEGRGDATPWTQCSAGVPLNQTERESIEVLLKCCMALAASVATSPSKCQVNFAQMFEMLPKTRWKLDLYIHLLG